MSRNNEREGLQLLLKKYKDIFRIPENLNHYSKKDFKIAERKFLKYALNKGRVLFNKNNNL